MTIKPIVKILKIRTAEEHQSTMNDAIHSTVSLGCYYVQVMLVQSPSVVI